MGFGVGAGVEMQEMLPKLGWLWPSGHAVHSEAPDALEYVSAGQREYVADKDAQ